MKIALAQVNSTVGDIAGNTQLILAAIEQAKSEYQADVLVLPELVVSGYPPEDLLLRSDFHSMLEQSVAEIAKHADGIALVLGYPKRQDGQLFNVVSFITGGAIVHTYQKQMLPNYSVFDEKRYFTAGTESCVFEYLGVKLALLICEDLWFPKPMQDAVDAGAELVLAPNASPYHCKQGEVRVEEMRQRVIETSTALAYVNLVGGQDELVFDGRSLVFQSDGSLATELDAFRAHMACLEWNNGQWNVMANDANLPTSLDEEMYRGLVMGARDYVRKNHFTGAIIGLSGGIDSALTLAIAVDALGAENVQAVMMPFRYTADMSIEDARKQAETLGVEFEVTSIEPIYESFVSALGKHLEGHPPDLTEQNLQSRCRGTLLMALSNKTGRMVLTTGNKSEVAVGYATLYGDMAGGFDVLKDVPKLWVYRLSRYRNQIEAVIPERVIERAPSAELAPDQKDDDSLPPYPVLDAILEAYVEQDKSVHEIVEMGFSREVVLHVMRLVDRSEYKRRQAAPGVRISQRAFGRDRRYPITSGFVNQLNNVE